MSDESYNINDVPPGDETSGQFMPSGEAVVEPLEPTVEPAPEPTPDPTPEPETEPEGVPG